tara:strand:- start:61 stop:264 length:204 start_codon:yes stop_codon:yes gene_type:complete
MCFGGSMPKQELPKPLPSRPPAPEPLAETMSNPLAIGYTQRGQRRLGKTAVTQTRNPTLDMGLGIPT